MNGRRLRPVVLAATLLMSLDELVEFQKLTADDLRARFGLPALCEPSVLALTTDPAGNRVTVVVDCRNRVPDPPASPARPGGPSDRRRGS